MVMSQYKGQPLISLYDLIGSFCETLGTQMWNEALVQQMVPMLINQLAATEDLNRSICPLFECFESVAVAIGKSYLETYAPYVFERCTSVIRKCLNSHIDESAKGVAVDENFFVRALDLVSVIFSTMEEKSSVLVAKYNFYQLLAECL